MTSCRGFSVERCLTQSCLRFSQGYFIVPFEILWDQIDQTPSRNTEDNSASGKCRIYVLQDNREGYRLSSAVPKFLTRLSLPLSNEIFMGMSLMGVGQ